MTTDPKHATARPAERILPGINRPFEDSPEPTLRFFSCARHALPKGDYGHSDAVFSPCATRLSLPRIRSSKQLKYLYFMGLWHISKTFDYICFAILRPHFLRVHHLESLILKYTYMKSRLLSLLVFLCMLPWTAQAQTFVNLTPKPKLMTVRQGTLPLPAEFVVNTTGLEEKSLAEVTRFVTEFNAATGLHASLATERDDALFQVSMLPSNITMKNGGYKLNVTADNVQVQAAGPLGFYYAFQSIKKMLPANVMAGVADTNVTEYTLPQVVITDEPRYEYRGFMLDVARHFFPVEQVKRMLDVMSYYKLNKFHWHLSDDQGWRVEIKKYPKLTTVGSIAPNSRFTDLDECTQYWINKPYGPYYYTQEEIKDVVAYAQKLHIDIIPEIDMPGHFVAAMASYPEYSCWPNGAHTVWSDGGISSDVMNVANPAAVQFAKDILSELMDLFPYEYIHIGGDECPTSAWEGNELCQAMYRDLGLTHYRQLQSHFIKDMSDFVKENGHKMAVWNEAITAGGADTQLIRQTGATVYCWTGPENAVNVASSLGLPSIYTPWGPYYINRKQGNSAQDPPGAGDGSDNVEKTYKTNPPAKTSYGVQGTFWAEHVSDKDYLEWLALPRLIAIAEHGWTPDARKDFADFQKRMSADTTLLNYGNYRYCKYKMLGTEETPGTDMVLPFVNTDENKYYYRIISGGTDATRKDRCIELLAAGSPLLTQYADKGATEGVIWTNTQAAEGADNYDAQWWSLEEDPDNPGHFALVNKAQPDGSLNPRPTATSTAGRWNYDNAGKHYSYVLGTGAYGKKGDNYYYTIASDQVSGQYLNSSMGGQGLAVNVYSNPNDGAGGQWEFSPAEAYSGTPGNPDTFEYLEVGKTYTFTNAVEGYEGITIADSGTGNLLQSSTDLYAANAWKVTSASVNADGTQQLALQNATTHRYIGAMGNYVSREGKPVSMAATQNEANLTLKYVPDHDAFRLMTSGNSLFPLPNGQVNAGTTINDASYDAATGQGAEWNLAEVKVVTFHCIDQKGQVLGDYTRSIPVAEEVGSNLCPTIKNTVVESMAEAGENTYNVTYRRIAYSITYRCVDSKGVIVAEVENTCGVDEDFTVNYPDVKYYDLQSAAVENGTKFTPEADRTLDAVYTTDALTGVKKVAEAVTTLENGKSYLLYDACSEVSRRGYRLIVPDTKRINRSTTDEALLPNAVWTLVGTGKSFRVKNEYMNLYVPTLERSQSATAAANGALFTFNLNDDGLTWNIKGANGMYWDGIESGDLVGWNGGTGHPIRIHKFYGQPMYTVVIVCKDTAGKELSRTEELIPAGQVYTIVLPTFEEYTMKSVSGNETYTGTVEGYVTVEAVYEGTNTAIDRIEAGEENAPSSIYDLQGRRLQRVGQGGIYIVNGHKVLVK